MPDSSPSLDPDSEAYEAAVFTAVRRELIAYLYRPWDPGEPVFHFDLLSAGLEGVHPDTRIVIRLRSRRTGEDKRPSVIEVWGNLSEHGRMSPDTFAGVIVSGAVES